MRFNNLKISTRLGLGFGALVTMVALVSLLGMSIARSTSNSINMIYNYRLLPITQLKQVVDNVSSDDEKKAFSDAMQKNDMYKISTLMRDVDKNRVARSFLAPSPHTTHRAGPQWAVYTTQGVDLCVQSSSPAGDFHPISSRPCWAHTHHCTGRCAIKTRNAGEYNR